MTTSTLFFDGVDLATIDHVIAADLSGMWAPMTRRGNFDVIPNRAGQLGSALPFDSYQFSVPVTISGDTEVDLNTHVFDLAAIVAGADGVGVLTRRLASAGGHTDYTAAGAFGGFSGFEFTGSAFDGEWELQCDLLFTNLDGGWLRTSDSVWVRP